MFALELSAIGDPTGAGWIHRAIRSLVEMLLRMDPDTEYRLCHRALGRAPALPIPRGATNARSQRLLDPCNDRLLRGARLLHVLGDRVPWTPRRIPKLASLYDLAPVRIPEWTPGDGAPARAARLRRAAARADHLIVCSAFAAQEALDEWKLDPERVHVVPLGVDTRAFRPLPPEEVVQVQERYGDYALCTGLPTPPDALERLAAAVARVAGLRLVVVGGDAAGALPPGESLESLGSRLIHLPRVSDAELLLLLNGATVFTNPSLYENFGMSALEAMACGAPVVASRAGALPEVAGDAALLVDATDVDALADALRRVVTDRELAGSLRERGLARAARWSWGRAAASLRAVYDEVVPG